MFRQTFDAGCYVDAVTLLGFRPFINVMRTGERRLIELLPEDPLEPKEREFYLALLHAAMGPGARAALRQELELRGLVEFAPGAKPKSPASRTKRRAK
jgi:hypothetical protein